MSRIFISYKRVDKDKVFKIKDQIESTLGEKCWIDLDGIESDAISHITLNAIEKASVVLLFYGKDTESSQWQRRELEYAKANDKTIIPICIVEIPEDSWYKFCFDHSTIIKYADGGCAELILKEILTTTQEECEPHNVQRKRRKQTAYNPTDPSPVTSIPTPILGKKSVSYTKSCGCGCLIGLVILIAIFLLSVLCDSAPEKVPMAESLQQCDSISQTHQDYDEVRASHEEQIMAEPPKSSASHSAKKSNSDKRDQGFDKRYDTKNLAQLSDGELNKEYVRTLIIADSLYESIRDDASARYDLQDLHRYQLLIREEQITRRANVVADTLESKNAAEEELYQNNVDAYLYNEDSSEKDSFPAWVLLAGLIAIVSSAMSILFIWKKKKMKSQGKEVLPLFRQKKEIKIFIAGSTRLVSEREALRATISKMYNQHKSDNLVVEAYEFDDFTREYVEGGQQKLYDKFIRNEANWVVFITDGTIGDKTIWELENAIKVHKETGHPKILMYSIPQNITDNQKEQMSQFKSILNREDNYWIDYEDVSTIRSTFREHLEWDLINLMKQELRRVG